MKSRIKYLTLFITIFFIILIRSGCSEKPSTSEITGLIFQVEKGGKTSYLMGSIHYSKDYLTLKEKADEAYMKSDRIAVEIDITDTKLSEQLNVDSSYGNNDTLDNHITSQTKEHITKILNEVGISYDKVKNYKPWIVSTVISNAQLQLSGYYSGRGVDMTLINRGKTDGKEIYSLETINEQIKALKFDESDQFGNELMQMCKGLNIVQEEFKTMTDAVFNGDLKAVESINTADSINYQKGKLKDWYSYLVYERNENLAERLDKLFIGDKTTFAIVGAGHLPGDKGVIKILEDKGYKITQIK